MREFALRPMGDFLPVLDQHQLQHLTGTPLSLKVTTGKGNCLIGFHWLIQKINNPIKPSVT